MTKSNESPIQSTPSQQKALRERYEAYCERELISIEPLDELGSPPHRNYSSWLLWKSAQPDLLALRDAIVAELKTEMIQTGGVQRHIFNSSLRTAINIITKAFAPLVEGE